MDKPDVSVTVPVTAPCVCARPVTTHDASRISTVRRRASERGLCLMFFSKVTCEHGQPAAACAVNLGRWPRPHKVAYGTRRCQATVWRLFTRSRSHAWSPRDRYGTVDRGRVAPVIYHGASVKCRARARRRRHRGRPPGRACATRPVTAEFSFPEQQAEPRAAAVRRPGRAGWRPELAEGEVHRRCSLRPRGRV